MYRMSKCVTKRTEPSKDSEKYRPVDVNDKFMCSIFEATCVHGYLLGKSGIQHSGGCALWNR